MKNASGSTTTDDSPKSRRLSRRIALNARVTCSARMLCSFAGCVLVGGVVRYLIEESLCPDQRSAPGLAKRLSLRGQANVVSPWAVGCTCLRCRKWRRMMCFRRRLGRHLSKVALNSYKITINHIILVASKRSRSNRILIEVCYEQISETFKLDHQAGFLAKAKERSNMKTIGASQ